MALGDVSVQPQRCAGYMLCLESYGSKSCVNPSFQPPKVTFGAVWMSLLDTAFLLESCSSALCCQEPGCNLSESCTFIGMYLLVNLIYSFQSVIKMSCNKGGKHYGENSSSSPKNEGRLFFLSAFA